MYLPGGGLPSEEVVIEGAVGGIKLGLQEDAAIGDGFQGGGTFVRKTKSNEKLDRKKKEEEEEEEIISVNTELLISRSTLFKRLFIKKQKCYVQTLEYFLSP